MNPMDGDAIDTQDVPAGYEMVDGQLKELAVGEVELGGGRVHVQLALHCQQNNLGWAFPQETTYRGLGKRRSVRKPDASFIRRGRLKNEELPEGGSANRPDLAVEAVSPNDTIYELFEKVEEYLEAGVRLVWVVDPQNRLALVYRPDGAVLKVREDQELSGEDVVPGFRCRLSEVLPPLSTSL